MCPFIAYCVTEFKTIFCGLIFWRLLSLPIVPNRGTENRQYSGFIEIMIFFHALLSPADFFSKLTFLKIISGIPSECQTDWIQIRLDMLLGLIWVQSVCKGYQQTTLAVILVIRARIHKMLVSIANREDAYQTTYSEAV